jgi:hypothetical protein
LPCILSLLSLALALLCQASSRRGALEVHEWHGVFRGEPATFKMTSVIGHVYSLDFPPAYSSWDRVDPLELFDAQTVKSEANPKVNCARTHSSSCTVNSTCRMKLDTQQLLHNPQRLQHTATLLGTRPYRADTAAVTAAVAGRHMLPR